MSEETSWLKQLRTMFVESGNQIRIDYQTAVRLKEKRGLCKKQIRDIDRQIKERYTKLGIVQKEKPIKLRERWFAIPVKDRVSYAHNRWLAEQRILVFTSSAESIGALFQLLNDSYLLARFLLRYEARTSREEDYSTREFVRQYRRFYGLKTELNAYDKKMPLPIEWSLRKDPAGAILIWNYPRSISLIEQKYFNNMEILCSHALFSDMPNEKETRQILMDATKRAIGAEVFADAVSNNPEVIQESREMTRRYSNQVGDENDKGLYERTRRWMKEVSPKHWMEETNPNPGAPYWEELRQRDDIQEMALFREIAALSASKQLHVARLSRIADNPSYVDVLIDIWMAFWLGLALTLIYGSFIAFIIGSFIGVIYLLYISLDHIGRALIALVNAIMEFIEKAIEICWTCVQIIVAMFIFLIIANMQNKKR